MAGDADVNSAIGQEWSQAFPPGAVSSREWAIQYAKRDAGTLLYPIRVLTKVNEPRKSWSPTEGWLAFASALIDYDAEIYLARLITEGVIQSEDIPLEWRALTSLKARPGSAIRWGRSHLARHVIACTLPTILGISLSD